MPRIHLGRVTGAIAALALATGLANWGVVSAMPTTQHPPLATRDTASAADLRTPAKDVFRYSRHGSTTPQPASACAFDWHSRRRMCVAPAVTDTLPAPPR
ncbi:MAG: hypothetical protein IT355_18470 [Gemmatimonadaceae bacterium]|nr:hypothetical protein [Gemmatimonadaceae bacterium]